MTARPARCTVGDMEHRTERMGIRLTPHEVTMLEELASLDGLTMADAFRMALRRWYEQRTAEQKAKSARGRRGEGR